jgi:alginate O-acetyltransferase complex protein AlgI
MVFSSLTFLYLFLPAVLIFLLIFRKLQYQNWILFLFSLLFYAWGGVSFTLLLLGSIFVNYIAGLLIDRYRKYGKSILFGAIILNLSTLFYFKYANFFVDNLNLLITRLGASSITIQKVILPVGISFFTFQGISYIVDVFRGNVAAQRNPVIIGSYIALFPQLIAGPIIRYNEIEAQFTRRNFTIENFYNGIKRFTLGLARKVFLANQLALIADSIFALETSEMTPLIAWAGILCYALQIYHDFAGYSDMAIGLGKMFGFTFPENFNFPYIAQSIQEFWRRWHITLSAWFKDYLYIPLGGNRCSKRHVLINLYIFFFQLFVTFLGYQALPSVRLEFQSVLHPQRNI